MLFVRHQAWNNEEHGQCCYYLYNITTQAARFGKHGRLRKESGTFKQARTYWRAASGYHHEEQDFSFTVWGRGKNGSGQSIAWR